MKYTSQQMTRHSPRPTQEISRAERGEEKQAGCNDKGSTTPT